MNNPFCVIARRRRCQKPRQAPLGELYRGLPTAKSSGNDFAGRFPKLVMDLKLLSTDRSQHFCVRSTLLDQLIERRHFMRYSEAEIQLLGDCYTVHCKPSDKQPGKILMLRLSC